MRRLLALLTLATLCCAPPAQAAPASVFVQCFSCTELRQAIQSDTTAVLVPVGGTD